MKFYYVYILQSEINQKRFDIGFTEDLDSRLKTHNTGGCDHTSKCKPWDVKTAVAFHDRQKALDFEKYLKSPWGSKYPFTRELGIGQSPQPWKESGMMMFRNLLDMLIGP